MRSTQPDRRRKTARTSRIARAAAESRRADTGDRRSRERLRELCDEVLASYRAATDGETLSADERAEADRLLARIAPLPRN